MHAERLGSDRERIHGMTPEDRSRVHALLQEIGGENVAWGAKNVLDVWIAESRMESERKSTDRLVGATWVLAVMTFGPVIATVGLIVVTVQRG